MKRSIKIILAISLLSIFSVWASNFYDFSTVLVTYLLAGLVFAGHAAYKILSSIFTLKDHPSEKKLVNEDIKRAIKFYEDNGLRLHIQTSNP